MGAAGGSARRQRQRAARRGRSRQKRPLLGLAVAAVLLLALELLVRGLYAPELEVMAGPVPARQGDAPILQGSPYLLFEYAPGVYEERGVQVRINSLGLRGPEPALPKPEGIRRLMTTGDSSVFGFGVPEEATFSSVAVGALGPSFEAINAAIPGYSTYQSLNLLRLRALRTEPDLVVIGNLWSDNNFDSFVDADLLAEYAGHEGSALARARGLLSRSAIFRVLDWKLRVQERAQRVRTVGWQVSGTSHGGLRRVAINDYAANLQALVDLAAGADAEVLFLLLPNFEDIRPRDAGFKAWTLYRQVLRDAAARNGAPLLDGPALFRASGLPPESLFLDEMHPTIAGHRLLGEALAALLRERGWPGGAALMAAPTGEPIPRYDDSFAHAMPAPIAAPRGGE